MRPMVLPAQRQSIGEIVKVFSYFVDLKRSGKMVVTLNDHCIYTV